MLLSDEDNKDKGYLEDLRVQSDNNSRTHSKHIPVLGNLTENGEEVWNKVQSLPTQSFWFSQRGRPEIIMKMNSPFYLQ